MNYLRIGVGVGRRGWRRSLFLLDGAIAHLRRQPLQHVVHGSLAGMTDTVVVIGQVVIVVVMVVEHGVLEVRSRRAALRGVPPSVAVLAHLVVVQGERRYRHRRQGVIVVVVHLLLLTHHPLTFVGRGAFFLDSVVDLAAGCGRR